MILYPALDLKDGASVRLMREEGAPVAVEIHDPLQQAEIFAAQGFGWLHIVDLNAAIEGNDINHDAIERILRYCPLPVQLGGGLRDLAAIEKRLAQGVQRVVLGTAAVSNPNLVRDAARAFPGKIAISIDAHDGIVTHAGWSELSGIKALDLALRFDDAGLAAIIYADINRNGAMGGIDVEATVDLAFALTTPVIAAGGITCMADLENLKAHEDAGIIGVIAGRALYDGRIDPAEALALIEGNTA